MGPGKPPLAARWILRGAVLAACLPAVAAGAGGPSFTRDVKPLLSNSRPRSTATR